MIELTDVSFEYTTFKRQSGFKGSVQDLFSRKFEKIQALQPTDLTLASGAMVGLIGPNGAGKTTLLKLLTGILVPKTGTVKVDGYLPSQKQKPFLQQIGVLLGQKSQLSWDLPPQATFDMLAAIYRLPKAQYQARLAELSLRLDATELLDIPVRKLSLGQRVRCELIAVLLHQPKYLFLDEPTLGLDLVTQRAIYEFLRTENKRYHTTIITTSHYVKDIEQLADQLLILMDGKVIYNEPLTCFTCNIAQHQFFTAEILTGDQVEKIRVEQEQLADFLAQVELKNLVSLKRQGLSLEDFIFELFEKGGKR